MKARPDFDVLFQLLNNLRVDGHWRCWIDYSVADEDICDLGEDLEQMVAKVKIILLVSHNFLTKTEEQVK